MRVQARRAASLIGLENTKDMIDAYSESTGSTGSTERTGYAELESRAAKMIDARYEGMKVSWHYDIIISYILLPCSEEFGHSRTEENLGTS